MKQSNPTKPQTIHQRFQNSFTEFQNQLKSFSYSIDPNDETIMDFSSDYSMEIGFTKSKIMGIYLSVSPHDNDDLDEFLDEFGKFSIEILATLKDLLTTIFSESTNSDACSFSIEINTQHASITDENPGEIEIHITDYLS